MKYLPVLLLSLSISFFARLQAQDLLLKGNVTYASNREAVPYCAIQVKDVALGTVTDYKGNFSITIPQAYRNHILIFSYVGMERQEIYIAQIPNPQNMQITLKEGVEELKEVIVQKNKLNAEKILKEAIDKIPVNYPQTYHYLDGYVRETLKENGVYIKYSDAVCRFYYGPYTGEYLDRKSELKSLTESDSLLAKLGSNLWQGLTNWGERLHDHFEQFYSRKDQLNILDARSNENQSPTSMNANIEGGPLGAISKDIVRYINWFMHKKNFNDYSYEAENDYDKNGNSCYVISFYPKKKPITNEELEQRISKQKRISREDILAGEIWIDEATHAFRTISFTVPPEYKKLICNLQKMALKHFGYQINVEYEQKNDKYWYLKKIERQDDFIIDDTLKVTPFQANVALFIDNVTTDTSIVKRLTGERVYNKYDMMPLYEEPLDYFPDFWVGYGQKNAMSIVPDSIRKDLEKTKSLERQFADKHIRNDSLQAPIAQIKPEIIEIHQEKLIDNYAWLKDTSQVRYNNEVMNYLKSENQYIDNYCVPLRRDQRVLYSRLMLRIPKETESLAYYENGYYYITKYEVDKEYPIVYRTKDTASKEQELLFDVNKMAEGKEFYQLSGYSISPKNDIIAYFENTTGSSFSTLYFKYATTAEKITDSLFHVASLIWDDNNSFYYTKQEKRTLRSFQVWKHQLNTSQAEDRLIYQEDDKEFNISISQSQDKEFIFINSSSDLSSEIRFKTAKDTDFKVIHPREADHVYQVAAYQNDFYIVSDKNAPDRQILKVSSSDYNIGNWKVIIPHQKNVLITDFKILPNYYVLRELKDAMYSIKIIDRKTKRSHYIKFEEEIFSCSLIEDENPDKDGNTVRIYFSSFVTPNTYYDYDIVKRKLSIIKNERKYGIYSKNFYTVERVYATAKDGRKIPITLLSHRFKKPSPSNTLWITGYGSYGGGLMPNYSPEVFSLIEAGFTYAIAHVRGGNECGKSWYEEGKMMNKMNTFTDFIACTEYLISQGYTSPAKIVAQGGSAGGLLMGAIANMRPDLYKTIILDVPFVDVINTMLDDKLPLTTGEYKEWGNPNIAEEYRYIKSYSPYDNVKTQNYPNMLFFTGLNDTNVGYWEPAKMVAKLRAMKTDANFIGLKTNLSAGHGGGSGRFTYYKEFSEKLALVLDLMKK